MSLDLEFIDSVSAPSADQDAALARFLLSLVRSATTTSTNTTTCGQEIEATAPKATFQQKINLQGHQTNEY